MAPELLISGGNVSDAGALSERSRRVSSGLLVYYSLGVKCIVPFWDIDIPSQFETA